MSKASFLYRVMKAYIRQQDKGCPYCGNVYTKLLNKKKIFLHLRKCSVCNLMFRWPKDTIGFNKEFYQSKYKQKGLTTDMPEPELLYKLKKNNFRGTEKDFSEKIAILKELVSHGKVLDFGCSWGYFTFQLQEAGYDATGFEISKQRADFGRNHLGVTIIDGYINLDKVKPSYFDIIFSSHVLEHLPMLNGIFERFNTLLKPGGFLLLFVPNCGGNNVKKFGVNWGPMICEKHPLAFSFDFFQTILPQYDFNVKLFSDPYNPNEIKACLLNNKNPIYPYGDELLACAIKVK